MHVFLDIRTFGLTPLSNKYPDINPLWDFLYTNLRSDML